MAEKLFGLFVDHVGTTFPVSRVDKKAVREWKALLLLYPVKATETKAFEGMKIAQIVAQTGSECEHREPSPIQPRRFLQLAGGAWIH